MSALYLKDTRDNDKALALVLVTKLLTVPALFLGGPTGHLSTAHSNEEQNAPAQATHQIDTDPSEDLEQVVGAGDQTEPKPGWDTPLGGTSTAQVAQHQVGVQVCQFGKGKQSQASVEHSRVDVVACCLRVGTEDPVGNVEAC